MLFTESELNVFNPLDILNEAEYLTEDESATEIITVPVVQNDYYNCNMIDFKDIERISEEYGCDYIDAMSAIIESENLNPDYTTIVIDEADFVLESIDGTVFHENTIIRPLSEDSFAYRYVDMCLEAWDNTGDEGYLGAIIDDGCLQEAADIINEMTHQQWLNVLANPDLTDKQKDTLGKRFYGKDVTDEQLANNIRAFTRTNQGKVDNPRISLGYGSNSSGNVTTSDQIAKEVSGNNDKYVSGNAKPASFLGKMSRRIKNAPQHLKATGAAFKKAWNSGEGFSDTAKKLGKAAWAHKGTIGATAVATGAAGYGIYRFAKWVKQARNKPKSWIGQKIAALRGIYQKWMQAAQRNPAKAGMIKSACAKILSIIDALLARLQSAAG